MKNEVKKENDINIKHYIYKITFPNQKVYIGQTINPKRRFKEHYNESKTIKSKQSHFLIYKAIRKYGFDNINFEIIDSSHNREGINKLEIYYIWLFRSIEPNFGYNLTKGGHYTNNRGMVVVLNLSNNNYEQITMKKFEKNRDKYKGVLYGKINVVDIITNNIVQITKTEYYNNSHKYIHINKNKIVVIDLLDNEKIKSIKTIKFHNNRDRYKSIVEGFVTCTNKNTNKKEYISSSEFKIRKNDDVYFHSKNKITVVDLETNQTKSIHKSNFYKNRNRYKSIHKDIVSCYNINTKCYESHTKTEFDKFEFLKGVNWGKRHMYNLKSNRTKLVNPNEIDYYVNNNWEFGLIKNRKN